MENLKKHYKGLLFTGIIVILSIFIEQKISIWIKIEGLTIAIVIGMIVNNILNVPNDFKEGIQFSLKKLLKWGIVLLGFKLDANQILKLGPKIIALIIFMVIFALLMSFVLGKFFNMNKHLSALLGVGSCICGASAVVAMAPCIKSSEEDSVIAVAIVSFLGAIGVILYSFLGMNVLGLNEIKYGIWSGVSLHGVAHAIAAAFAGGDVAGQIGTFVKMGRVLMLVPVSLLLSFLFKNEDGKRAPFPKYVIFFVAAGVLNSFGIIPKTIQNILINFSNIFIMMAMTAMGLSVKFKSIKDKGLHALSAGSLLFLIISTTSFLIIKFWI